MLIVSCFFCVVPALLVKDHFTAKAQSTQRKLLVTPRHSGLRRNDGE
jgi:hypothetical protein